MHFHLAKVIHYHVICTSAKKKSDWPWRFFAHNIIQRSNACMHAFKRGVFHMFAGCSVVAQHSFLNSFQLCHYYLLKGTLTVFGVVWP